ncbi:MAG TPA: ABC transporter permease [Micromonosporaceae bacterium]|jgi:peptide/nickel transport system permease protein
MARFLLRRVIYLVLLAAIATTLAYFLAATQLNPKLRFEGRNPPPSPASVTATLNDLNMNPDTPVLKRYATWVNGVFHGDLGKTILGQSVNQQISTRIWVSLRLVLLGSIIGAIIGCAVGAYSAVKQYRLSDHAATIVSFVVLSIPIVVLCKIVEEIGVSLNNAAGTTLFYTVGEYTPGKSSWTSFPDLWNRAQHMFLPTLVLVIAAAAFYSRYQRSAMLDILGQDFLRTAQAKGLTRTRALIKHGLRTALIPLTTFFAYNIALLFIGSFFVEIIFSWHGMGEYLVNAITAQDINSTAATTLFVAILVLLAGVLSDIAYAALDPRVRVS